MAEGLDEGCNFIWQAIHEIACDQEQIRCFTIREDTPASHCLRSQHRADVEIRELYEFESIETRRKIREAQINPRDAWIPVGFGCAVARAYGRYA